MEDYEKVYDEFWKEIIEDENGNVNMDQLKKELFDFKAIMNNASEVYTHVTGGAISKPNSRSQDVIKLADEHYTGNLKPHPDYDFRNEDEVLVENADGSFNYFILLYAKETAEWVLVPFKDKHFTVPSEVQAERLSAYGYDLIELVSDYDLEDLP